MFVYTAYGLGIHSALPLPELVAAQSACDVVVRLAAEDYVPLGIRADTWCVHITPEDAWLAFDRVGMFRVRNGRAILVTPANGVDERLLQLNLVGLVLAVLLYQRGLLVLHASAVRVGRYAVAFMAESGQGKSSTALALHTRGHGMIADDVLPVDLSGGAAMIAPGFPQFKLAPSVAVRLGVARESLLPLHPLEEKCGYRPAYAFSSEPLPLRCIYVLQQSQTARIEPVHPREGMIELVRHSYPTRLGHAGGSEHFRQCAALVQQIPIYRLCRTCDLDSLPDFVQMIEDHLASMPSMHA